MTHFKRFISFSEPFEYNNTATSCHDPHVFERVKRVFRTSHSRLNAKRDPECLFSQPFWGVLNKDSAAGLH